MACVEDCISEKDCMNNGKIHSYKTIIVFYDVIYIGLHIWINTG